MRDNLQKAIEAYREIRGREVVVDMIAEEKDEATLRFSGPMIDHDPDAFITDFLYEYEDISGRELEMVAYRVVEGAFEVVVKHKN